MSKQMKLRIKILRIMRIKILRIKILRVVVSWIKMINVFKQMNVGINRQINVRDLLNKLHNKIRKMYIKGLFNKLLVNKKP